MSLTLPPENLAVGIAWAVLAGLCWGISFIAGLMLPGFSAVEISAGRYLAYGMFSAIALLFAVRFGRGTGIGEPAVWVSALGFSLLGNVTYFVAITAAVRYANAPIGSLIIGMLPVAMPLAANLAERTFAWSRLAIPAALMMLGLALVHIAESSPNDGVLGTGTDYWFGIALYLTALLAWTLYGIANARFLARRSDIDGGTWASLQGVALLPLALPLLAISVATDAQLSGRAWGPFIAVSILLGVIASWTALVCWNRVTQLLPPSIAGQLLVFETISGLGYAYAWKGSWPPLMVVVGSVSLIAGVTLGVRKLAIQSR